MRSPAQAIIWEICARNRWALFLAYGLILFAALCGWLTPPGHESIGVLQGFSALTTFVCVIWICSYTADDSRQSFAGFPSWMYTLPLRTSILVIYPMLLGVVLMLLAVMGWELTIAAYWNRPLEPLPISWHALLAVAALLFVQAAIWSLHRFRWIRVVVLVATIYGFFYVAVVGPLWNFTGGNKLWFLSVALTIPLAMAGAMAGVERDRRGQWQGWTGKLLERLLDLIPRRNGQFNSAAHARLWLEWRRKVFFAATFFGFTLAFWVFTYPLSAALYLTPVQTLINFSGPFIGMVLMAGLIGNGMGKPDPWARELALHPIAATRPSSNAEIVFTKMKATLAVALLGWALFATLLWPVIALSSRLEWAGEQNLRFWQEFTVNYPKFWRWLSNPLVILALLAATWHTAVQTMAIMLTGHKRQIVFRTWLGILVMVAVAVTVVWLVNHPWQVDAFLRFLPWLLAVMMALKAWGTVRAFVAVKPLVSQRDFLILGGLWVLVALSVLTAGFLAHVAGGLPASVLRTLVLWQFFPAGEIPQCVISLGQNRHR